MANQEITARLKLQSEGLTEAADEAGRAHKELLGAARAAEALSRAQADSARKATLRSTKENVEYGQMRGTAGATGAASRDFAEQSRGLGGLVRLYATVAANVFALTAAFNALSRAMDTTNMIAGLDALGASSGRSLGTLSKQLSQVSDGAISLREAMSATAMSSSAGMTNQQILRMGEVAKNASLALGISMPDAINRLSRGITKLEPELLDELGIFTKIEPAVQSYALQLGKSVSSLTDFERRQAFANAVLKEGEDKFSAIGDQIAANPYDKLSASLKNVAQNGLELINTVLAPIADILSKSPAALTGGLLLLTATLTKKALPALGEFRQSLNIERKKAQELVAQKKQDTVAAGEALGELASKRVLQQMEANAESELKIFEQKEAKLNQLKKNGVAYSQQLNSLLKKDIHDISEQEVADAKQAARVKLNVARNAYNEMRDLEKSGQFTFKASDRRKIIEEITSARAEMATVTALEKTTKAEQAYIDARQNGIATETERLQQSRQYQNLLRAEEQLTTQARRSQIIANMAYNTSIIGIRDAFKLMRAEAEAAGNVGNAFTLSFKALAAGIGTIFTSALGAVGSIIQAITLAITAFAALDAAVSSNAKESQKFNDAIDNSESSIKAVVNTLDQYEKKGSNSIKSTIALATAFGELSDSIEISISRFQKMQAAAGNWDVFWDRVKGVFGYGQADKLAETLSNQLYAALDVADKFSKKGELEARLQEYLGVENLYDEKELAKKIKGLDYLGKQGLSGIAENFKKTFQEVAGTLDSFSANLDKSYKSFQQFIQGLALTDPFAKFADNYARLAIDMSKISGMGAGEQLKAIEELLQNPEKLVQFDDSFVKGLFGISQQFKEAKYELDAYQNQIAIMKRSLADLDKQLAAGGGAPRSKLGDTYRTTTTFKRDAAEVADTQKDLQQRRDDLAKSLEINQKYVDNTLKLAQVFKDGSQLFAEESDRALKKAAEYTGMAIQNSSIRASNTIAAAYASSLSGPQAVAEQTRLAKSEQAIKVREAQIALNMLNSQDSLNNAIQELTAAVNINTEMQKPDSVERTANIQRIQRGKDIATATRMAMEGADQNQIMSAIGVDPRGRGVRADNEYASQIVDAAMKAKVARDQRLGMAQAKVGEEQAKLSAIDIKGGIEVRAAEIAQQRELKDIANTINQTKLSQIDIARQIVGVTTLESINEKSKLEDINRQSTQKLEIADIDRRIAEAETGYRKAQNAEQQQYYRDQLNFLQGNSDLQTEGLKDLIKQRQAQEDVVAKMRQRAEALQVEIETIRKSAELEKSNRDLVNAKLEAGLEIRRAQFTSAAELYDLDKQYVVNRTAELDIEKADLDIRKQQGDLQADLNTKRLEAESRIAALNQLNDAQKAERVREEFARLESINKNQLQALETEKSKRLEILEIQRQQALKQAELAYETDQAARYADALQGAFGNAGKKLGELATTLIASNQQQLKDQEAIKRAEQASAQANADSLDFYKKYGYESEELTKKVTEATDAETRTKKKARDNELAGNAKSIAMTKAMFKEHTAAYKILATLEKVQHIQRMINMGVEFATKVGNLATEVAAKATAEAAETGLTFGGFMSRAGIYITEIFSKITSQLGVFGPAVAAGIVAAIGLGAFGRGKGGGGFVPNAEQQQKVQGTAMGYDSSGKEVQVRRGVFGDTSAKSESIAKSLETIKNTSVDGLDYDNKILKALQSIDAGINKTAKSLYSVQGLRTGSMFGTTEGARTSGGLLGISSLFGSSTTTNIQDAGILISGSFADLASATNKGALDFYEVVQRIVKKSGFFGIGGSTKTYIDQNTREVTDEVSQLFSSIFSNAQQTITELATKTGVMTEKQVTTALSALQITDVKLSLKGLKGEELAKEVESVISSILDDAALAVFKSFENFANFGEGMLETVIRVVDTNEKIAQQVRNLGIGVNLTNLFNVTEGLAAAAGGLDKFIEQTQFFRENFLTEAERLAPISQAVGKELGRLSQVFPGLGIEAVDTKEEFKTLVQGLDLTTQGGQTLFNSLMTIQEGFLQIVDASEQLSEGQKLVKDLETEIFGLTSTLSELDKSLLNIDKKAADYIDQLEKTGKATAENILVIGKWVQATKLDLLKNAVVSSYNAVQDGLKNQISTLTTLKQRLVDLKNSLMQGAESILTPQEKLIAAQTEYNTLLEAAKVGDQAAVDKFSGYAQTLLTATRDVFSSGEEYTLAFNRVMQDIDTVTAKVSGDLSTAEKSLAANEATAMGIDAIKNALTIGGKTLAQLQSEFNTAFADYRKTEAQGAIDAVKESAIKNSVIELYGKVLGRAPEKGGLDFWTQGLMSGATSLAVVEDLIRTSAEGINYAAKLKQDQAILTEALKPVVTVQAPIQDTTLINNINNGIQEFKAAIEKQSTKTDDDVREGDSLNAQENLQAQLLAAQQKAVIAKKYTAEIAGRYGTLVTYNEN